MANEPITDIILQTASGFYRRKLVVGMAVVLTDGALKIIDTSGAYTFPRADAATVPPAAAAPTVPAAAITPIAFQPVTLEIGPSGQFQRVAAAFASLDSSKPLDVTVTLDPSVEHVNDTSSHYWEAQGHLIDWPPFEQTIPWKLLMQSKPGSGKLAVLRNDPVSLYYGKGILDVAPNWPGADQTYRGLHFIGAKRGDGDGRLCSLWLEPTAAQAAITIEDCEIEAADNGILNGGPNMDVVLRRVYVHDCGSGSGFTHNAYIGAVASLLLEDVLSVRASVGHLLKSRAAKTTVRRARLFDLDTGTASYCLDLPNAGVVDIDGLVTQKGANASNAPIFSMGEEGTGNGGQWPVSSLKVRNWTALSDRADALLLWNAGSTPADIAGTKLFGVKAGMQTGLYGATTLAAFPDASLITLGAMPALDLSSPVRP